MADFHTNPASGRHIVFFCTKRRGLQLGNVVYLSDQDSKCFRTETEALAFEVPWEEWGGRAAVFAVETENGVVFSEGEQEGVIKKVRPIKPPSGYIRGAKTGAYFYGGLTVADGEWERRAAELGLLDEGG